MVNSLRYSLWSKSGRHQVQHRDQSISNPPPSIQPASQLPEQQQVGWVGAGAPAGSYPDTSEAGRGPERTESPECPQHPHGGDVVHGDEMSQLTQHWDLRGHTCFTHYPRHIWRLNQFIHSQIWPEILFSLTLISLVPSTNSQWDCSIGFSNTRLWYWHVLFSKIWCLQMNLVSSVLNNTGSRVHDVCVVFKWLSREARRC